LNNFNELCILVFYLERICYNCNYHFYKKEKLLIVKQGGIMKLKISLVLLIAAIAISIVPDKLSAQRSSYNEAITVEPLNFLINGIINAKYEQKLSPTNSFTVGGLLAYSHPSGGTWLGIGVGGSYRWYVDLFKTRQKPIQGFSVGPRASILYLSFDNEQNASPLKNGTIFRIGGEANYKWIWDAFVLEAGILLEFPVLNGSDFEPGAFGLNASIGYAW
jgi:hypothetical protein